MAEDTRLLREQVERCRVILSKLTSLGDDDQESFLGAMSLGHLIEELASPHRSFGIEIKISCSGDGPEPFCQRSPGLMYGLGNLVDNAVDFALTTLKIDAHWSADTVWIELRDDGPGFAPEVLLRVGEPYVTTRGSRQPNDENASGLGLGLFIAKTLIERSGAQLTLSNVMAPGSGAIARIVWPRSAFEGESVHLRTASPATGTLTMA
jgi:two-component system sensor histidine kinase RegB